MSRFCSTPGERRDAYSVLMGKPEGNTRPKLMWKDNIKTDLRAIEWNGLGWIRLA
jgi:hypothetical protein